MTYAAITGWGKCMPPSVLTNADLATFLDTSDEWIAQRTGIHERRMSHVPASRWRTSRRRARSRARASPATDLDLIVYGSCSNDEHIPNSASGLSVKLGAGSAAAMDVNTACTSFLHGLSTANAMIRTGVVKNALIVGVEMDFAVHGLAQPQRGRAVRRRVRGRGAAGRRDEESGVLAEKLGCYADRAADPPRPRQRPRVRLTRATSRTATRCGTSTARRSSSAPSSAWASRPSRRSRRAGKTPADIDLVVPHQANLRIIEFVAKRAGIAMDRVFLTVHKYGNMSAATVPVALVEALESGRVHPGDLLLTPAFGGGLTFCSHVIRWGERVTPLGESDVALPPCDRSALDIVRDHMKRRDPRGRSLAGLTSPGVHRRRAASRDGALPRLRAGAARSRRAGRVRPGAASPPPRRASARAPKALPSADLGEELRTFDRDVLAAPAAAARPAPHRRGARRRWREARRSSARASRRTSRRWRRGSASRCRRRIAHFSRRATA